MTKNRVAPCPALLADRFRTLRYDPELNAVVVLDRRKYPLASEYVHCHTVEEVAQAIETMVVQGGPPLAYVAGLGLVLATQSGSEAQLRGAAARLLRTRPTADDLHHIVPRALQHGLNALREGMDAASTILEYVNGEIARGNRVAEKCGRFAADLLDDGDRILTHCIAGAALCQMLWIASQEQGKHIELIACETRPYLQGARLTAASAREMGVRVHLITDGMSAHLMSQGMITKFICAADRITMDGHITNKVGTFAHALASHYHGLPFYVLGYDGPDPNTPSAADVEIEWRNPEEVFYARGRLEGRDATIRTAIEGIEGYYPAFDITPPHLITAIVTDRGVFPASLVSQYWEDSSSTS